MTKDEIEQVVNEIMIEEFELEPEQLSREAQLGSGLELDSLDGVDLVVAIEKRLHCRIEEEQARAMRTLGDVYDCIHDLLKE